MKLDINEVKKLRDDSCNEIARTILKFENETGVRVDDVVIEHEIIDVSLIGEVRAIRVKLPITI